MRFDSSVISLSRYGSFPANDVVGRPYYHTYEILDKQDKTNKLHSTLRIIPPTELYADIEDDDTSTPNGDSTIQTDGGVEYDIVGEDGQLVLRSNRQTIDDPNQQTMTMDEIEALKAKGVSGTELVAKIIESHSGLDQKTAFALAKYTKRKRQKYLKRFTVMPLDVATLANWIYNDKEPMKILEIREEVLSLIGSWSNVHQTPVDQNISSDADSNPQSRGRWLVVDETAGLLVAYMAEKMGILDRTALTSEDSNDAPDLQGPTSDAVKDGVDEVQTSKPHSQAPRIENRRYPAAANENTIHLIHSATQPNVSLLKYFQYNTSNPTPGHPLARHLKSLSWLQLLDPSQDTAYMRPEEASEAEVKSWKGGRRAHYHKKWRRWERTKSTVDEARAGGFDGLIVASIMHPTTILRELVPLLRGGAPVVVYNRSLEVLAEVADLYSTPRRTAFVNDPPAGLLLAEDFPVNPSLLLGVAVHTVRARPWQVLPGRTHPLMTGKGGTDGFIFTATRVLPAEGKVTARGSAKRRKVNGGEAVAVASPVLAATEAMPAAE